LSREEVASGRSRRVEAVALLYWMILSWLQPRRRSQRTLQEGTKLKEETAVFRTLVPFAAFDS